MKRMDSGATSMERGNRFFFFSRAEVDAHRRGRTAGRRPWSEGLRLFTTKIAKILTNYTTVQYYGLLLTSDRITGTNSKGPAGDNKSDILFKNMSK